MDKSAVFRRALETFPDGIIITDENDELAFINDAAERIRHITRADKIGHNVLDCHKAESRERVARALDYLAKKQGTFKRMVIDSGEGKVYENVYKTLADESGAKLGTIIVSKDITDKSKVDEVNVNESRRLKLEISSLTDKLTKLFYESLTALVNTLEAKDVYTRGHSERVTVMCRRFVLETLGPTQLLADVELAAKFHDIGKIGIPERILNKPGKLDADETACMRTHPTITEQILLPFTNLKDVIGIAKHHHERYDGSGYPDGLAGGNIPIGSRILALADTYDAMTSTRPYRAAIGVPEAIASITASLGTQFDPELGRQFIELVETGSV